MESTDARKFHTKIICWNLFLDIAVSCPCVYTCSKRSVLRRQIQIEIQNVGVLPVWKAKSNISSVGQWALYISAVRSSGHRVKPNMAANGGPNLRRLSLPTRSFIFTRIVKIAQGDWNRRNLEPPCPPYLASLFVRSVTGRSHSIYIYMELTGVGLLWRRAYVLNITLCFPYWQYMYM